MPNVELYKPKRVPTFRKIAMGTWTSAKDPSVYGSIEVDMTEVYKYLPAYQEKTGCKVTPAHLVGRAITLCMLRRPEINGMIRSGTIYLRKHAALFFQVNIPGDGPKSIEKANLAGTVIHEAEKLTLQGLCQVLKEKANRIKQGQDAEIKRNMDMFKLIPWSLTTLYLNFISWLMYGLNLDLRFLGVPKDPFGSIMITNVGSLGIDMAWAPLVPYSRVPALLTVGGVTDKALVIDGKIEARKVLPIGVTFDHRLIDGVHAAQMAKDFKRCFAEPELFLFDDKPVTEVVKLF